jgi:hypothetical protein
MILGNGSNLIIFDASGAPIACQRGVSFTANDELIDVTCKQDNGYANFLPGKRTFSVSGDALVDWEENLLRWSEDFGNAFWVKTATTITTNAITSPDGTLTADEIEEDGTLSTHRVTSGTISTIALSTYTVSVYAKFNNVSFIYLNIDGNNGVFFDIENGLLGTEDVGYIGTIEDVNNGWYRCSVTFLAPTTSTSVFIFLSPDGSTLSYTGTLNNSVYLWGAQLNSGTSAGGYYQTNASANPNIATLVSAFENRTPVTMTIADPSNTDVYFEGDGYIESLEANAGTEDVASYTFSVSGTGDFVSQVS